MIAYQITANNRNTSEASRGLVVDRICCLYPRTQKQIDAPLAELTLDACAVTEDGAVTSNEINNEIFLELEGVTVSVVLHSAPVAAVCVYYLSQYCGGVFHGAGSL